MSKISMVMFDLSGTTVYDDTGVRDCLYKAAAEFDLKTMVDYLKSKEIAMFKLPEHLEIVGEFPAVGDSGKVNKEILKKDIRKKLGLDSQ